MRRRKDPSSSLEEPLLGDSSDDTTDIKVHGDTKKARDGTTPLSSPTNSMERDQAVAAWQQVFSSFLMNWAGLLRHILLGGQSVLGAIFQTVTSLTAVQRAKAPALERLPPIELSPAAEERLRRLQQRIGVPFDETSPEHKEALNTLWTSVYPGRDRTAENEVSGWKDMGWQGNNPASDFRGGGLLSLENLVYFAQKYSRSFQKLMLKQEGRRAEWEYPFAAAGVNLTVMLTDMLDLRSSQPGTLPGRTFLKLLEEDEEAFEKLYCVMFEALDAKWLELKASYMEFNVVLKETKKAMEAALADLQTLQDLPNYETLQS